MYILLTSDTELLQLPSPKSPTFLGTQHDDPCNEATPPKKATEDVFGHSLFEAFNKLDIKSPAMARAARQEVIAGFVPTYVYDEGREISVQTNFRHILGALAHRSSTQGP